MKKMENYYLLKKVAFILLLLYSIPIFSQVQVIQVDVLRKKFDTSVYSSAVPMGNDIFITAGFCSIRENGKELVTQMSGKMVVDMGVMFVIERSCEHGLRLFVISSDKTLASATLYPLQARVEKGEAYYEYRAHFDVIKNKRNVDSRLSLYTQINSQEKLSSIMFNIDNTTYELCGSGYNANGTQCNIYDFINSK